MELALLEALVRAIQPVAFMEFLRFDYLRAERNIADRAAGRQHRSAAEAASKRSEDELAKLGTFEAQATSSQNHISEIRREVEAVDIVLAAKKQELQAEKRNLARINGNIQTQEGVLAAATLASEAAWRQVQEIGDDDEDLGTLANIDAIRTRAINTINAFL